MSEAMVSINNDTVRCLPTASFCVGSYTSVDSIKVFFENGFSSNWVPVKNTEDIIVPVVEVAYFSSSYILLNRRYRVLKSAVQLVAFFD
ncbi:hypothetical protein JMG10_25480 [Nostoc ellipsosporum NOK]|nr:hypothetical protein [Nostoc ellipsosporum NOK]